MARPILVLPDPRLRSRARPVRLPDRGIRRLADELLSTMRTAGGMGLAAPQVGEPLRLIVARVGATELVIANPVLVRARGSAEDWEGCLSVPNRVARLRRPIEVVVTGQALDGRRVRYRRDGLLARVLAHELDHLDGRLYVDLVTVDALVDTTVHPVPPPDTLPAS
jgi:peptide deformylase